MQLSLYLRWDRNIRQVNPDTLLVAPVISVLRPRN